MPIPFRDPQYEFITALTRTLAITNRLPNEAVDASLPRAVFPTSRYRREHPRFSQIQENASSRGVTISAQEFFAPSWKAAKCYERGRNPTPREPLRAEGRRAGGVEEVAAAPGVYREPLTMPDNPPPQSAMILYQTEDGRTRIQ